MILAARAIAPGPLVLPRTRVHSAADIISSLASAVDSPPTFQLYLTERVLSDIAENAVCYSYQLSRLFSLSHHVKELSVTKLNGGTDVHEICNSDPKLVFVLHDIGDSRLNFWRLRIRWQRG